MKRMNVIIGEDGTYEIDLKEGFSGMSCIEKSKEIQLILGGNEIEKKEKPEMYDIEEQVIGLDINIGF